ncbi:MAG: KaiB-like protein [Bacteroidetes bacterium]|nr:KaiB-like protein [Bacteroidota bacterium]
MKKASPHFIKENYKFILFVSGMSVKSLRAIENIRKIGTDYFNDNFDLQIIDISKDQAAASKHQIVAIPSLVKESPDPRRVIVGDLSDTTRVLKILEITE